MEIKMELEYEKYEVEDKDYLLRNDFYGVSPEEREIEEMLERGCVILDKPRKVSCTDLVLHIKKILNLRKCAHVGTLDPNATGVLPILFNRSVKLNYYLSQGNKEYIGLMILHKEVEDEKIRDVFFKFKGEIEQLPPKKSAVRRRWRKRKIHELEILEIKHNRYVLFRAFVEHGTYIRALCRDIGDVLGVKAHLQELRRTFSLGFHEDEAINFHAFNEYIYAFHYGNKDILKEVIVPIECVLWRNYKKIFVKDGAFSAICYGAPLYKSGIVMYEKNIKNGEIIAVYNCNKMCLGLMKVQSEINRAKKKEVIAKPLSLLYSPGEIPKMW